MYEENNQYQTYNSMPYDNTTANSAGTAPAENTAAPQGTAGNSGNNNGNFWKKIGTSAACALVFGAVAGVTMIGVNSGAARRNTEPAAVESTVAAETGVAAAENAGADGKKEAGTQAETKAQAENKAPAETKAQAGASAETSAAAKADELFRQAVQHYIDRCLFVLVTDPEAESLFRFPCRKVRAGSGKELEKHIRGSLGGSGLLLDRAVRKIKKRL